MGFGFNGGGGGGALFVAAAADAPGVYGGGGAAALEPGTGGGTFLRLEFEGMRAGGVVRDGVRELELAVDAVVADRPKLPG